MQKKSLLFLFFIFGFLTAYSQASTPTAIVVKDSVKPQGMDPLKPAKAAFYSAVLPGLGQAYNKRYWKIPIVYGAIGTSMYYYLDSKKKYTQFRDEYKRRLEGFDRSEELKRYDDETLIRGQKFYQRNKDYSALFMVAFYVLNIIDANVDAALTQFNVNDNLSLKPNIYTNDASYRSNIALTLNYNF